MHLITRRDVCVAAVTAVLMTGVLGSYVFARSQVPNQPILGPATFDWRDMQVVETGAVYHVINWSVHKE